MDVSPFVEELWREFRATGDRAARDRLVVHYSPLVKYVAARVWAGLPAGVDQDDLISDGVMGLMGAMESFDLDRGQQFRTFAQPRIRGAIIDGLRAADWVPRLVREQMRDTHAATADLEHRLQRRPGEAEVAAELGITGRELSRRSSQGAHAALCAVEVHLMEHAISPRATEGVPGGSDDLPEGFLHAVHGLPERDRVVMALYYWERMSLAEIGQVLEVSESRVSQLMRRATDELRRLVA